MNNKIQTFSQIGAVFEWKPAAWLSVSGEDAFPFLQGQFSNDLRPIQAGGSVYGLWLDRKGKVTADGFVLPDPQVPGTIRIASYNSSADTIRQRLEGFIVADDVSVTDESSVWTGLTVSAAAETPAIAERLRELGAVTFAGRRGFAAREWLLPAQHVQDASLETFVRERPKLTSAQMEELRINARIPAIPGDIGPADLPQEGELEADAVSFSKGCYLGQEVMARLKTMGAVRRKLFRVHAKGEVPALPAPLFQNGKRIGELRTAVSREAELVGLALLATINLVTESPLSLAEKDSSNNVFIDLS